MKGIAAHFSSDSQKSGLRGAQGSRGHAEVREVSLPDRLHARLLFSGLRDCGGNILQKMSSLPLVVSFIYFHEPPPNQREGERKSFKKNVFLTLLLL